MDDVLVVGDGIAGLALARALRRQDVPVTVAQRGGAAVLDAATLGDGPDVTLGATPSDVLGATPSAVPGATPSAGLGAGLGAAASPAVNLPGNAIAAFAALGLAEELQKLGRPTIRREYRNRRGRLLFTVDEDAFWGPEARPRCVRRPDLLALLADGPAHPLEVTGVDTSGEVTLGDGTRRQFGFVAAADGVDSLVRTAVDPAAPAPVAAGHGWRFLAPNPGVDCWTSWSGPGSAVVLTPVDDTDVYGYATSLSLSLSLSLRDDNPQQTFASYPATARQALDTMTDCHHAPVVETRTATWSAGRCALIGETAHATVPVWAQGTAMAVEDGLVLADLLATVPWDGAGAAYTDLRRDRIAHVRAATDRFTRVASLPSWLRDTALSVWGPRAYRDTYSRLRHPFPTP